MIGTVYKTNTSSHPVRRVNTYIIEFQKGNTMKVTKRQKNIKDSQYISTYTVCLNEKSNGGEAITLSIDLFNNGDEFYSNADLELFCYGEHSTSIEI